jgi:hypothetical protein
VDGEVPPGGRFATAVAAVAWPAVTATLIAQVEHGPQMHGGIVPMVLVAIALVGGIAYLVHRGRKGS